MKKDKECHKFWGERTPAEQKAFWENYHLKKEESKELVKSYSGPVTKLPPAPFKSEYGDKEWTVKSKNYKRNGNLK